MEKRKSLLVMLGVGAVASSLIGCQPKTPAQKAEDKIEDAGHNAGQAMERAGERVKDKSN